MSRNLDTLIGCTFDGNSIHKMTLKEMLLALGGEEKDNGIFFENSPMMDIYPLLLEDDGMGYGINEEFICDVNVHTGAIDNDRCINIWKEKEFCGKLDECSDCKVKKYFKAFEEAKTNGK